MRNSAGPVCKQVRMQTVSSETTVLHNLDNSATFTLTLLYLINFLTTDIHLTTVINHKGAHY